jgi:thymidylate synthase (FAD)
MQNVANFQDPYFRVEVLSSTSNPQTVIYSGLHQDYCEDFVWDKINKFPSEQRCGEIAIEQLLASNRHHWGPIEHPQIVFNVGWFPHSAMQQMRTHRTGISFDVQSGRYTSQRILDVAEGKRDIEEVFYLRPVGFYTDRQGAKYNYTQEQRDEDIKLIRNNVLRYALRIAEGLSEEHSRGLIPFDIRQHWVMSCNMRTLCHLINMRGKKDAQLECQVLSYKLLEHFHMWAPQIAQWFEKNMYLKGRLAP